MVNGREGLFSPNNSPTFAYDGIERIEDLLGNAVNLPKFDEKELIQLLDNPLVAADYLEELDHPYFVQLAKRLRREDGHMVKNFIVDSLGNIDFKCKTCNALGYMYTLSDNRNVYGGHYNVWLCMDCCINKLNHSDKIKVQA